MITSFADPAVDEFRSEVREWVSRSIPPRWKERVIRPVSPDEEIAIRRDWDAILYAGGYAGLTWPTEYGGRGVGPIEEYVFFEECAEAHAPDVLNLIGKFLAGPAIMESGTDDQKERFLPAILRGEQLWCEGFSEPNAGSDLAAVSTTALRDGDVYRIKGVKVWTSLAQMADRCYLLARTSLTERKHHNLSILLLAMRQPSIRIVPIRQANEAEEFNRVFFDGAAASVADRLGDENDGWRLSALTGFRTQRGTYDAARRYVFIRESFDQFAECSATVRHDRGEVEALRTKLELLRWHLMRTTEMKAAGRPWSQPVAILKLYWSELWQEITDRGFALGCPDHEDFWRTRYIESRPATIYGGSAQIQRNVIAERVLNLPK